MLRKIRSCLHFTKHTKKNLSDLTNKQDGNIFFMLFGAVAVVGLLGTAVMSTMRGPLSTMVEIQSRTQAESEMAIASRLALLEATELASDGDCDGDGFVEPLEFADAGGLGPVGGGFLPNEIASSHIDPWGTEYGYCAWDAGAATGTLACDIDSSGINNRSDGNSDPTDETYTIIAIISAGPDQVFGTTCTGGATPSIAKTGDDMVVEYTYASATSATNGLWHLQSGDPTIAEISKNLEITGEASFSAGIDLTGSSEALALGAASMLFPNQGVLEYCTSANDGLIRINTSADPDFLELCDYSTGWVAVGGPDLWTANSSNEIYFDSAGTTEVGIGTTSPDHTLDIDGTLESTGAVDFGSTLNVAGAGTFQSSVSVVGSYLSGTGNISTVSGTVSGNILAGNTLLIGNAASIGGTLGVAAAVDFDSTLNVDGISTLANVNAQATTVTTLNATDAVDFDTTLNVDGTSTLADVNAQGTISNSSGNVNIGDTVDISETLNITQNLNVTGDGDIDGTLEADDYTWGGNDFTPETCASGRFNRWDGSSWVCEDDTVGGGGGGSSSLNALSDVAITSPADGSCLTYDNGSGDWIDTDCTSTTSAGIFENASNVIRVKSSAGDYATDDFVFGSPQLDDDGDTDHDARMFFDKSKAAFRVGEQNGGRWDDTSIGRYSFAAGWRTLASGQTSTALGRNVDAIGDYSLAWGWDNEAFGTRSVTFGRNIQTGASASESFAFGLGVMTGRAQVSAANSFGIFMGDQTGVDLATANTMLLAGGKLVIDSAVPATETSASTGGEQDLELDVTGDIGADNYCDADGNNCTAAANLGGGLWTDLGGGRIHYGTTSANQIGVGTSNPQTTLDVNGGIRVGSVSGGATPTFMNLGDLGDTDTSSQADNTCLVYQIGSSTWEAIDCATAAAGNNVFQITSGVVNTVDTNAPYTTADFVFGSPQLDDDGDANHDNRMFFDKSKGAFRVGTETGTNWDDANVGTNSIALGRSANASGNDSAAMGAQVTASGLSSFAIGLRNTAGGQGSFALGIDARATNTRSIAIGNQVTTSGQYSLGFGLGGGAGTDPTISGFNSLGIFMGDQSGVDLAVSNRMGLYGGDFLIDDDGTAGSQGCIRYVEGTGLEFSDDCTTYSTFTSLGGGLWTDNTTHITRENFHVLNTGATMTSAGFDTGVVGMAYHTDKQALRIGQAVSNQWQETRIGDYSVAFGSNSQAQGTGAFAAGNNVNASGFASASLGDSVASTGTGSIALGGDLIVSGIRSIVMGQETLVSGDNSMGIGLGNATGTDPTVSGDNSLGIFMGDQSGVDLTGANTMAILGGNVGIGTVSPLEELHVRKSDAGDPPIIQVQNDAAFGGVGIRLMRNSSKDGSAFVNFGNGNSVNEWGIGVRNSDLDFAIWDSDTGDVNRFEIDATTGYVGIGNFSSDTIDSTLHLATGDIRLDGVIGNEAGCIRYNDTTDELEFSDDCTTFATISSIAGSAGLWTDNTTHVTRENFHILNTGLAAGSTTAGLDGDGTYAFFDPDKGALRGGSIGSSNDAWQDANIGPNSFAWGSNAQASSTNSRAMGNHVTASGGYSTAIGSWSTASGNSSATIGTSNVASGDYSTTIGRWNTASGTYGVAIGTNGTASGSRAIALGSNATAAGDYSLAFGAGYDIDTSAGADATVSGDYSVGVFMGDQDGIDIANANTMAILGGDFIVGSYQLDDTGDVNHQNRMFFDKSKGAFRAGRAFSTQWDNANVGDYSFAVGANTTASSLYDFAVGEGSVASGSNSFAVGTGAIASNYQSFALGENLTTSGAYSFGFGTGITVSGDNSVGLGLGFPAGTAPIISGAESVGIFMGDQAGYDLATANRMALVGGDFLIDDDGTAGSQGCIRYVEGTGLQFSDDCTTYSSFGDLWTDNTTHISRGNMHVINTGETPTTAGIASGLSETFMWHADQGALRLGRYNTAGYLDDANIGLLSFATGNQPIASGNYSVSMGYQTQATMNSSIAIGTYARATGARAIALGNTVIADGQYAFGFGLGNAAGTAPTISADSSFGIFMGDQSGYDLTTANRMALVGGDFLIDDDGTAGSQGCIRYTEGTGLEYSDDCATYATFASLGSGLWTDNTTHITRENTHILDAGSTMTTAGFDAGVSGFVFHTDKNALRAGRASGNHWQESNIGVDSIALGADVTASGQYSIALGYNADATGYGSFAWGYNSNASGNSSMAFGGESTASGPDSMIFGKGSTASGSFGLAIGTDATAAGDYSLAFGAGYDIDSSAGADPAVSGDYSIGFFMGDNDGIDITDANTMAIMGGDFIVGSYQLDDTATGSQDNRMFFDTSKGAFRAGGVNSAEWDDANVGNYSFAVGRGTTASGAYSFATGNNSTASGDNSTSTGLANTASGGGSTAFGAFSNASGWVSFAAGDTARSTGSNSVALGQQSRATADFTLSIGQNIAATGTNSIVLGHDVAAGDGLFVGGNPANGSLNPTVGDHSMAIGLGNMSGEAIVTGNSSFGIFMGDQGGVDLAVNNRMGLYGGDFLIDDDGTAGSQGCIRYTEGTGLEFSHDCSTYSTMGNVASGVLAIDDLSDAYTDYATYRNFFLGHDGGTIGTTDTNNTGIGISALDSLNNLDADNNVAIGYDALDSLTSGDNNTAIGTDAMAAYNGSYSVAIGDSAMENSTSGNNTIAIGNGTLASLVGGDNNIAIGFDTMDNVTTGGDNIAIGRSALDDNLDSSYNIAIGTRAMENYEGAAIGANVAIGHNAMQGVNASTTGVENTSVGGYSGEDITSGEDNVFLGFRAGDNITTGSGNIIIGHDVDAQSNTGDDQLNIGNLIYGDLANGDFIVGSYQLDDTATGTEDNRMFFDSSKGAFRAGVVTGTEWDDANVGNHSFAAGSNNTVVGWGATAFGGNNVASGDESFTAGSGNTASGQSAVAFGIGATASNQNTFAMGNGGTTASGEGSFAFAGAVTSGDYSASFGLGQPLGALPIVSGDSSFSIFMGDQSGYDLTTANRMALVGGDFLIDDDGTAGSQGCIRYTEGTGLEYSHDCSTYATMGAVASGALTIDDLSDAYTDYVTNDNFFLGHEGGTNFGANNELNTAIGVDALISLDSASSTGSLGDSNTAIGTTSLTALTSGAYNTAIGDGTGESLTTGTGNTVIGASALNSGTVSNRNVAIGQAAAENATGHNNTMVGALSGIYFRTGNSNTFLGHNAGRGNTTDYTYDGTENIIIGQDTAINLDNTNDQNTIIGTAAAATLTGGGSRNILLGYGVDVLTATTSDHLNIGNLIYGDLANGDFIVGSYQLNDTGTGTEDNRMFFDSSKGAFRAGGVDAIQWDDASIGDYSTALGHGTVASGVISHATGDNTTASGDYSHATGASTTASGEISHTTGYDTTASGDVSHATGASTTASGDYSFTTGREVTAGSGTADGDINATVLGAGLGHYSMAYGLQSETQATDPIITGDRSMVLFFDGDTGNANSTYDFADSDKFALIGGELQIGETQAQGAAKGCIRYNDTNDELEYSNDCTTYATFASAGTNAINDLTDGITDYATDFNIFMGDSAGASIATGGQYNIGIGQDALTANATGDYNIALGYEALNAATENNNIAIGYQAGYNTATATTMDKFTGVGYQAGYSNTGDNVTAVGYQAAELNTGATITAFGYQAAENNSGNLNVLVGYEAGENNTGSASVAVGNYAIRDNTGSYIAALGNGAARDNTGSYVTALGYQAARENTGGSVTAIGHDAVRYRNATNSVVIGRQAGYGANTTRADTVNSVFLGYRAGYGIDTGDNNIFLGYQAGDATTTGSDNILIGYDVDTPLATTSDHLNIGNLIYGDLANEYLMLGNPNMLTLDNSLQRYQFYSSNDRSDFAIGTANNTSKSDIDIFRARGSISLETAVQDNDVLGSIRFTGYDGDTFETRAQIKGEIDGTVSDETVPTALVFSTGTTSQIERMRIDASGNVGIGDFSNDTIDSTLHLAAGDIRLDGGAAGQAGCIRFDDTSDALEYSDDCSTYSTFASAGANAINDLTDAVTDYATDNNMFIGQDAGTSIASGGIQNLFIGQNSGTATTTGDYNTAIGYNTLAANIIGTNNSATGNRTLESNTTGIDNTATGDSTMRANTIGSSNTAIGNSALRSNVAKSRNTAIGYQSMFYADNTITASNSNNTAIGYQALYGSTTAANNTGINNTSIGANTMLNNTSGGHNIALGYQTGDLNTTGSDNILIGYDIDAPTATTSNHLNIGGLIYGDLANGVVMFGTTDSTNDVDYSDPFMKSSNGLDVWYRTFSNNTGIKTDIDFQKAGGTEASPIAISDGHTLGGIRFSGYDGDSWENRAGINGEIDGTVSNETVPTALTFNTGSTSIAERMRISAAGDIGIGTDSPTDILTIVGDGQDIHHYSYSNTFNYKPDWYGYRARGTEASPTIVQDGDLLAGIGGHAYDGNSWELTGQIWFEVNGTPADESVPTDIVFSTGVNSAIERMRIDSNGDIIMAGRGALTLHSGATAVRPSTPVNGMIRYNTDNNAFEGYENSTWTNIIGGGGLWTDNTTHVTRESFHILDAGLAAGSTTAGLDGDGTYAFYDPDKGAMRGGEILSSAPSWQDTNIGTNSFAWGGAVEASGTYSAALGFSSTASGYVSTALGYGTTASGDFSTSIGYGSESSALYSFASGRDSTASGERSTALGQNATAAGYASFAAGRNGNASGYVATTLGNDVEASGDWGIAFGNEVRVGDGTIDATTPWTADGTPGEFSVAYGLGAPAGTHPQVSGVGSFGIFMGDQSGYDLTTNNRMALVGGDLLIDDDGTAGSQGCIRFVEGTGLEYSHDCTTYATMGTLSAIAINDLTDGRELNSSLYMGTGTAPSATNDGNMILGLGSAGDLTNGRHNTVFGNGAMATNETGNANVAIGRSALAGNTSTDANATSNNIAIGYQSMRYTYGNNNVAIGYTSLENAGESDENVAIGLESGTALNTDGSNSNTFLGFRSASNQTAGSDNIVIGANQDAANLTGSDQLNIGGLIYGDLANGDFIVGSYQLDDTATGTEDNRMFFDSSKGAFRAGTVTGTEWDDGNVGSNSIAFGSGTTASGNFSAAFGSGSTASGIGSTAFGAGSTASGVGGFAAGGAAIASGVFSTAIGSEVVAGSGTAGDGNGDASVVIGLQTSPQTTDPIVTGDRSMVLFFDQGSINGNGAYDFTESDKFAIIGGEFQIGETQAQGAAKGCIRYNDTSNALEFSHDCSTYVTMAGVGGGLIDADADTQIQVEEGADDDTIRFDTAGTERMVIGSTGNVGIATTSPAATLDISAATGAYPKLMMTATDITSPDFSGSASVGVGSSTNVFGLIQHNLGASGTNTEGGMYINGITESGENAWNPLHLVGTHGGTAPTTAAVTISSQKWSGTNNRASLSGTEIVLDVERGYKQSTTLMRLLADGSLGLGDFKSDIIESALHIQTGDIRLDGGAGNEEGCIRFDDTTDKLQFSNDCTTFTDIDNASIGLSDADADTLIQVEEGSDDDTIRFDTAGTERLVIDNAGNVGIGTDSPTYMLTITGDNKDFALYSHNGATPSNGTDILLHRSAGTYDTPTAVSADDKLGGLRFIGYDGTAYERAAAIYAYVDTGATIADEDIPAYLSFHTRSTANTDSIERMVLTSAGDLNISTASAILTLGDGSANNGTPSLDFLGDSTNKGARIQYDGISDTLIIRGLDTNKAEQPLAIAVARDTGYVGIATAIPNVALDVTGDIEYTGTITDVSDRRLKDNIVALNQSGDLLDRIAQIDTYSFTMKDDEKGRTEYGVMAQELEEIFPTLVHTADDEIGTKSVNYVGLIAPMIEATKELRAENTALKSGLDDLSQQVALLNKMAGNNVGKASMQSYLMLLLGLLGGVGLMLILQRKKQG